MVLLTLSAEALDLEEWRRENMAAIDAVALLPPEESFAILGSRLEIGGGHELTPEQSEVFHRAQELLLSKPGHARFLQKKMDRMLEVLSAEPDPDRKALIYYNSEPGPEIEGVTLLGYSYREVLIDLSRLRFLPSAESVAVLASYLKHPEGRDGKIASGQPCADQSAQGISLDATMCLMKIGIENPPIINRIEGESDWVQVDAWKEWWDEIEAGVRTYRLKGSPIEFGPDGPVDPATIKRLSRDSAGLAVGKAGAGDLRGDLDLEAEAKGGPKVGVIAALVVALGLLAIAGWRVLLRKRRV